MDKPQVTFILRIEHNLTTSKMYRVDYTCTLITFHKCRWTQVGLVFTQVNLHWCAFYMTN